MFSVLPEDQAFNCLSSYLVGIGVLAPKLKKRLVWAALKKESRCRILFVIGSYQSFAGVGVPKYNVVESLQLVAPHIQLGSIECDHAPRLKANTRNLGMTAFVINERSCRRVSINMLGRDYFGWYFHPNRCTTIHGVLAVDLNDDGLTSAGCVCWKEGNSSVGGHGDCLKITIRAYRRQTGEVCIAYVTKLPRSLNIPGGRPKMPAFLDCPDCVR